MKNLLTLGLCLISFFGFSQVAISDQAGNPVPDSSAILDLQSSDRGFLPPRMTTVDRNSISNPATGLIIYNTTSRCVETYHDIQGWTQISCDCQNPPSPAFTPPIAPVQFASENFSANTAGVNYSWTFQGGSPASSSSQNPSVTWSSPGSFLVSLVVTDAQGCSDSSGMIITVSPCTPTPATFTNPGAGVVNVAANFSANAAGVNYAWTFQSGSPATSSVQNPSVTWTAAGTYNVQLIVTDPSGCADTSTSTITISNCVSGGSQTFSYTGAAVPFVIPNACGAITIEAWGAQGGDNSNGGTGGLGARMRGDFNSLTPGDTLWVVVGGQGGADQYTSGGGGGSGVATNSGTPLVIAGGGAGVNGSGWANKHGVTSPNGQDGQSNGGSGGTGGNDGSGWVYSSVNFAYGGRGFNSGNQGSTGQNGVSSSTTTTNGTFGLGGGGGSVGSGACNCGGGGGGYSGGGSGNINASGGGGGSFNSGTNQSNTAGTRSGNGQVVISW